MSVGPTKILIVDDSALYRQSINNVLREVADVDVVGSAKNGVEALEKIRQLAPDLLTLDVQMPDMDGIQVLRQIKKRRLNAKAIMVSSFTAAGAQVTTDALMEGAFDFILKPSQRDSSSNRQYLKDALSEKIMAFRDSSDQRSAASGRAASSRQVASGDVAESGPVPTAACQAVVIGTSTGGPEALKVVVTKLPVELSVPVLVVQHMPATYTRTLAKRLDELSPLSVVEADDGMAATRGTVLMAPGSRQMKLEKANGGLIVRVTDDPPENGTRPSVDYLIRSVAEVLDGNVLTVIMTGMGRDGLAGCREIKQRGGYVFAQSQDDCVVYGMPKAVIEDGLADRILPLGKIAPAIVRHVKRSRRT